MGDFKESVINWSVTREDAESFYDVAKADEMFNKVELTPREWTRLCLLVDDKIEEFIQQQIVEQIDFIVNTREYK